MLLRHECGYEESMYCKNCRQPLTYNPRLGIYCPSCGREVTMLCPGCGQRW
jgi:hypothetical protein